MSLYDKKIEQFSNRIEQLDLNIKRDTEKRKKLESEIARLRYLSLCEKLNCDGNTLEAVLAREHDQIQRLKASGMTDEDIYDLGKSENGNDKIISFTSEED